VSITQAKVAIITVTFNSSAFIEDYIQSITPFITNNQHHLIIIDNASIDNTCQLIRQYATDKQLSNNIQLITLEDNIGFGKGCNKGAEFAKTIDATHLWFLNPDTKVFEDSGSQLLSLLEKNESIDFAGSLLVNKDMEPRSGAFRFPTLMNVFLSTMKLGVLDKIFKKHTTAAPIQSTPYQTDWLTGASFMVRSPCYYSLKGFDPYYFLYFEEVDLFYRANKKGFSVWACPDSKVFHISGASTGINTQKKERKRLPAYWFESRRFFYLNNDGAAYFTAVDSILVISHMVWSLRATIQGKDDDTPPYFIRDILRYGLLRKIFHTDKHS